MLYLKCTNDIQKTLGLRKEQITEAQISEAPLGNWYIQRFNVEGYTSYLFMSDRTFLSFILFEGRKKFSPEALPMMFLGGLQQLLQMLEIPQATIDQALSHYHVGLFSKTNSRSDLGVLNNLIQHYLWCIEDEGGVQQCNLSPIIFSVNNIIQRRLNWQTSIEATKQELGLKKP